MYAKIGSHSLNGKVRSLMGRVKAPSGNVSCRIRDGVGTVGDMET